ncbi:MAG: hypothetical protein C0453_02335 [Comamonadaceae bacterium]|nr:hypothetical protein [Comamonadaceae bacterium]
MGVAALLMSSSGVMAQTDAQGQDTEVRGIVQLWAPAAQRIEVDGRTYRLARDVQVVDRETRLLKPHQVRSGVPVMLLVTESQDVSHVVVNPGPSSPFDGARQ